jgi:zinc protease
MEVHVVEDHSTPAFTLYISYDVGSRDEVKGRTGFAHFFEHMMFQGSKNMPDNAIAENTSEAGGYVNAATSFDSTIYFHAIPSQYLDMVLWGEADRLSGLEITQETFEAQRAAVKSEKDRAENNPSFQIFENLVKDLFAGTPYNHMPIGTLEDLNAAEAGDTQTFFDTYYVPNNATMVIVGDVEFGEVKTKVEKYFGAIPKGADKPPPPKSEQQRGKKIEREIKDSRTKQTIYVFAWPTVGQDHPDRAALDLLGAILAGGRSSRLPKILDDEKKLTVGTGGGHMLVLRDAGGMAVITVPTGDKTNPDEIKKIVAEEIKKVGKKGVTKKELEKAYNQQVMGVLNTMSTNAGRAGVIADGAMAYGDPKRVITDLERCKAVTAKDIKRVAAKYMTEDWMFYALVPE